MRGGHRRYAAGVRALLPCCNVRVRKGCVCEQMNVLWKSMYIPDARTNVMLRTYVCCELARLYAGMHASLMRWRIQQVRVCVRWPGC